MKQIFIFLVLLVSWFQVSAQSQHIYQNKTFLFSLQLTGFDKTSMWGASDSAVKSIKVTRLKDHKAIQTIIPEENYITEPQRELIFEDFNFDGYMDFKLFAFEAKHAQAGYFFYLFDPNTQKFTYSEKISELLGDAAIDKKNKTLSRLYRVGGGDYKLVVYSYIKNKLILIEERKDQSIGNNKIEITQKKRVKGILKIVKHLIMGSEEYSKTEDRLMPI